MSDVAYSQAKTSSSVPPPSVQATGHRYFPEVDGIRAIAVLIVMFCHARLLGLPGGFIGVDIFFVISGYVVTLSITSQQESGRFALSSFYARRLQRLLPSLYTVSLATLAFCLFFSFPESNAKLVENLGFIILFGSNFFLARQTGYFDVESAKQPLLHTWSLSVEEQFYLILPLCFVLLRRYQPRTRTIAVFAALVLALAWSILRTEQVGMGGYYFLPARLFEFLTGIALALVIGRLAVLRSWLADCLVLLGIAAVALCCVQYGSQTLMPGSNAILPCAAAVLLLVGGRYAGALQPVLTNPVLRYLGRISYPLYLWHWPLIFALNRLGLTEPHWMWLALGASLVLAALTHRWIETPWRGRQEPPGRTWRTLWAAPFLIVLSLFALSKATDNFSMLYPQKYRTDYLEAGRTVFEHPRASKCWIKVPVTKAADCTLGAPASPLKAVLWGDSHSYQQIGLLDGIGKARNIAIHDMGYPTCPPIGNSPERAGDPGLQGHATRCHAHDLAVMAYILDNPQIKIVFMAAAWGLYDDHAGYPGPNPRGYRPGQFETELAATVARLNAAGKRVVLLDDVPSLPAEQINCASDRLYLPRFAQRDCSFSRVIADRQYQYTAGLLGRIIQASPTTALINTFDVLCDDTRCYAELDGVPLYKHHDDGHLSAGASRIFYKLYMRKHPQQLDQIFSSP